MFVKNGSKGNDVRLVQQLLNKHGYGLEPDGHFGGITERAVRDFQKKRKLLVDGIVGDTTYGELQKVETYKPISSDIPWLKLAYKEIGVHEVRNEDKVHGYWRSAKLSGLARYSASKIAWCAGFVGAMLENAGIRSARTDGAKNYLNWGRPLDEPCDGCVVVFTRKGGAHVGFVVGHDEKGNLLVLGGNQGNAVNIKSFPRSRVTGYRYPEFFEPTYQLTKGDGTELSDNEQ